jgi:hypothetical protein
VQPSAGRANNHLVERSASLRSLAFAVHALNILPCYRTLKSKYTHRGPSDELLIHLKKDVPMIDKGTCAAQLAAHVFALAGLGGTLHIFSYVFSSIHGHPERQIGQAAIVFQDAD